MTDKTTLEIVDNQLDMAGKIGCPACAFSIAETKQIRDQLNGCGEALEVLLVLGQTDGDHHKAWVIDQAVQCLTGAEYKAVIRAYRSGEDGPETYSWDEGIAP